MAPRAVAPFQRHANIGPQVEVAAHLRPQAGPHAGEALLVLPSRRDFISPAPAGIKEALFSICTAWTTEFSSNKLIHNAQNNFLDFLILNKNF